MTTKFLGIQILLMILIYGNLGFCSEGSGEDEYETEDFSDFGQKHVTSIKFINGRQISTTKNTNNSETTIENKTPIGAEDEVQAEPTLEIKTITGEITLEPLDITKEATDKSTPTRPTTTTAVITQSVTVKNMSKPNITSKITQKPQEIEEDEFDLFENFKNWLKKPAFENTQKPMDLVTTSVEKSEKTTKILVTKPTTARHNATSQKIVTTKNTVITDKKEPNPKMVIIESEDAAEENQSAVMVFVKNKLVDKIEERRKLVNKREWIRDIIKRSSCPTTFQLLGGFNVTMNKTGFYITNKKDIAQVVFGNNDKFTRRIQQLISNHRTEYVIPEDVCNDVMVDAVKTVHQEVTTAEFAELMNSNDEDKIIKTVVEIVYVVEQVQKHCPKIELSEFDFQKLQEEALVYSGILDSQEHEAVLKCSNELCIYPKKANKKIGTWKMIIVLTLTITLIWIIVKLSRKFRKTRNRRTAPYSYKGTDEEEQAKLKLMAVNFSTKINKENGVNTNMETISAVIATVWSIIQVLLIWLPNQAIVDVVCQDLGLNGAAEINN